MRENYLNSHFRILYRKCEMMQEADFFAQIQAEPQMLFCIGRMILSAVEHFKYVGHIIFRNFFSGIFDAALLFADRNPDRAAFYIAGNRVG